HCSGSARANSKHRSTRANSDRRYSGATRANSDRWYSGSARANSDRRYSGATRANSDRSARARSDGHCPGCGSLGSEPRHVCPLVVSFLAE
uniref:Uncharacterized protein n=1 Tax=Oryzias melastigma TaxID=30732 RepID=A0A3B3DCS1_ORYME